MDRCQQRPAFTNPHLTGIGLAEILTSNPARRPFPGAIGIGTRPADPGREMFAHIAAATGGEVFDWTTEQDLGKARFAAEG